MKIDDVRRTAYSMPLTNPSFPRGPYRFFNREYFVTTYRTDPDALAAVVPEPLEVAEPVVKYEFIPCPFDRLRRLHRDRAGDPGPLQGRRGRLRPFDVSGRRGADRRWPRAVGISQETGLAEIAVESDVLVGTLHYGSVLCASATMGYKHRPVDHDAVLKGMKTPNFMLKIIPHVDGTPRICELVRYCLEDITLKEAWSGPAALGLFPHALADVARLPVREVVSALHCKADLTLGLGTVAFDYMVK